ncbi:MAG: hypothetical protein H5T97_11970, partial [Firmicutes bacterium]|nr:hypothetical protein [Bacillota bacterium]
MEARAQFDGPEVPVFVRVAEANGKIYLDLCRGSWQAAEIDPTGWRVVDKPPVKFRRARGMLPLPLPERGGSLELLRQYVNPLLGGDEWVLLVAWLVASLHPAGPYPIFVLQGEQGSGKSLAARLLRALIDPNVAPLRTV